MPAPDLARMARQAAANATLDDNTRRLMASVADKLDRAPIKPLTRAQFRNAGRMIYGKEWKSPLARAMGLDWSSVNRKEKGRAPLDERDRWALIGLAHAAGITERATYKRLKLEPQAENTEFMTDRESLQLAQGEHTSSS